MAEAPVGLWAAALGGRCGSRWRQFPMALARLTCGVCPALPSSGSLGRSGAWSCGAGVGHPRGLTLPSSGQHCGLYTAQPWAFRGLRLGPGGAAPDGVGCRSPPRGPPGEQTVVLGRGIQAVGRGGGWPAFLLEPCARLPVCPPLTLRTREVLRSAGVCWPLSVWALLRVWLCPVTLLALVRWVRQKGH